VKAAVQGDDAALPPALLLAAGKGTRLGDLGRRCPKVLVPIRGRPLLDLHLDHLASEGVEHVVINAHHLADQITAHVRGHRGSIDLTVVVEPELLGTAGAAINALESLRSDTFFVIYGDVVMFEPLTPLLKAHREAGAVATLCVYAHDDVREKGVVEATSDGAITAFAEKDRDRTEPGLVNAGLYVVEADLLAGWPKNSVLDFGHDVFPAVLDAGQPLHAYRISRPVLDIGTPTDLAKAVAQPDRCPDSA
jgi:mannose-1-phosphate guanylyltransferase